MKENCASRGGGPTSASTRVRLALSPAHERELQYEHGPGGSLAWAMSIMSIVVGFVYHVPSRPSNNFASLCFRKHSMCKWKAFGISDQTKTKDGSNGSENFSGSLWIEHRS